MSENKPLILVTNDDGDTAKGIHVLTRLMMQLGDVVVVAPDAPRSAQSNALTVNHPLRVKKLEHKPGLIRYSCNGTPTDCVKLALNELLPKKPDLLVSGINHGSNASINVIYSGTMGAVLEGCEHAIPSVGFSISNFEPDADFSQFEPYIRQITQQVLKDGLPYGICLNVNAPGTDIKGLKVVRQCEGHWTKEFVKATDPQGRDYFWLTGFFDNHELDAQDTDEWVLVNGYVAVVPTKIDLTAHEYIENLKERLEI